MKKFLLFCTVFIFLLPSVFAQKTVRVGYYDCDGTLQAGFSDNTRKSGYYYDFYQDIAEYTDWVYEYVYGSYDEILQKLYDGEIDIVAGIAKSDKHKGKVLFPQNKMGTFSYSIFAPLGIDTSDEIVAKSETPVRIAMKKNTYIRYELMEDYAKQFSFKYEPVPYASIEDRVKAFHDGKIDYILTLDTERMDNFKPLYKLGNVDIYFAVNKNKPDILRELDTAMERLFEFLPSYVISLTDKYFNLLEGQSLTSEEKLALYEMKKLRFGFVSNSMPISAVDKNGNIYGLAKDVADYLGNFLGIEVEPIVYKGSNELLAGLLNREIDVAYPMYNDDWIAEKRGYKQTEPFISNRVMLVYKGEYRNDLFDKIGIGKSTIGQRSYLAEHYPNANLVEYETREEYFDAIERGEVNCSLGNESILQRFIRENPKYNNLNIVYVPHTENFGLAVNVDRPLLLESLNKAVQQLDQATIINALVSYAYIEKPFSLWAFIKEYAIVFMFIMIAIVVAIVFVSISYVKKLQKIRAKEAKTQKVIKEAYIASSNANNVKSSFLSNMSHDIRTPVNAIIGMTAIAKCNTDNKERVSDCLQKISKSSKHLLDILNNILDMSKIDAGMMGLEMNPFDLDDLIQSVYGSVEDAAKRKNIDFTFSSQGVKHKNVIGDGQRLQQVFINLVENAIQFTDNGGKVSMTVSELQSSSPKRGCYEFVVQDNGHGMSEEFQEKLFQPFMREDDDALNPKDAGTGLGLAISRNIVQMMGGDIKVYSVLGEGSKFTVTVFMEWQVNPGEEEESEDDEDIDLEEFAKTDFSGKRALLVEDNELNAEITAEILKMAKLEVDFAPDGMEAVNKMLSTPDGYYDIVFMDVQMPVMNGYETTAAIRSYDSDYMRNVPIITMTAYTFADDIAHARNSGMNEHIAKPLKFKRLLKTLNTWLADKTDENQTK